jgi:hypothetical protein
MDTFYILFCLLYLILAVTRMEANPSKIGYASPFVFLNHVEKHGQRSHFLLGSALVIGQMVPKKMNKVSGSSGVSTRAQFWSEGYRKLALT